MSDGALKADVIKALNEHGVVVEPSDQPMYYRLSSQSATIVVRLYDVVSGTITEGLHRAFGIPKSKFYPPLKAVVVQMPTKASSSDS